jgi:hypothetical protein
LPLSHEQLDTLRDLRRKKRGADVGWISIPVTRGLTELGLAAREPSGWRITPAGEARLERSGAMARTSSTVLPFPAPPGMMTP